MKKLFVIAVLFAAHGLAAQSEEWGGDTGKIVLHMPVEVEALLERHKSYIHKLEGLPGYRIQIAATSTLRDIKEVRRDVEEEFEEFRTYTIFSNPNYRLQVGDYRTRIDAHRDLIIIRKKFPQAFISRGPVSIRTP